MEDEKKDPGQKKKTAAPDAPAPDASEGDWNDDGYIGLDDDERKAVDDDEVLSNPG